MTGNNVTTVREALMAELLQDADALVRRFEQVDIALAERMEKAAADAAGKSFLAFRLQFESMVQANSDKLTDAGRHAAACIGNQLRDSATEIVARNVSLDRAAYRILLWLALLCMVAGAAGGFVGAKLAGA